MGDLQQWAAFSLGLNGPEDRLLNSAQINGDVGVAGNGDIALTNSATIDGDVYLRQWGVMQTGPGTVITGSQFHGANTLLSDGAPMR